MDRWSTGALDLERRERADDERAPTACLLLVTSAIVATVHRPLVGAVTIAAAR